MDKYEAMAREAIKSIYGARQIRDFDRNHIVSDFYILDSLIPDVAAALKQLEQDTLERAAKVAEDCISDTDHDEDTDSGIYTAKFIARNIRTLKNEAK